MVIKVVVFKFLLKCVTRCNKFNKLKRKFKKLHLMWTRNYLPDIQCEKHFFCTFVETPFSGDCWVVAAVACLTSPDHQELFRRIVPADQGFQEGWYAGLFRFNFWHFGKWKEVIVDDRLPTYRGELMFIHSHQKTEFWGALLEKAYAKYVIPFVRKILAVQHTYKDSVDSRKLETVVV